jgi:hypothetical protein
VGESDRHSSHNSFQQNQSSQAIDLNLTKDGVSFGSALKNARNLRGYGILSGCGIAVPRAPFESIELQQFSKGVGVTSVRAGCRQVIDVLTIVAEDRLKPVNGRSVENNNFAGLLPNLMCPLWACK